MAFCTLSYKAYKLNKKLKRYKHEKDNAIRIKNGLPPVYTTSDKFHHFWSRCCYYLRRMFTLSPDNRLRQFCNKICMDGTSVKYYTKIILGLLSGNILTCILFMFFVIQLKFSLFGATLWCLLLGLILTVGMAFSRTVRVVVLLFLPQFFSKHGRRALMAYALFLALTGPTKNTLQNVEKLSESMACAQEKLKAAVRQINDAVKKPFMTIKEAIKKVMLTTKAIVKKVKATMKAVKRITLSILRVMKSAGKWLNSIISVCNKNTGTPFQRCMRVFDDAVTDCQARIGPLFRWMCSVTYVPSSVCYLVKIFDYVCMLVDFVNESVIETVKEKLSAFAVHTRDMYYVSVEFKHKFHFETNQSVTMKEIAAGMFAEIHNRTNKFVALSDWISFAFSFFFLIMLFKVIYYRHKFLTNDRFDNRFITADFRDIERQRMKRDKETVLPLNKREKRQYIMVRSIYLVSSEKVKLAKAAVFLGIASFKLSIHMITDYCLYWVLTTIRQHGRVKTTVDASSTVGVHVQGEGMLADLYRSVVKAFTPLGAKMEIDSAPCLPDPISPDFRSYLQIASIIIGCWLLLILEPYGLRLRHVVMCYYYPDRAKQRSVWLYNHILRSRGSFLKYARRQLRRKYGKGKDGVIEEVGLMDRLRSQFPFLSIILGKSSQKTCILCSQVAKEEDEQQLITCPTPKCSGQYCLDCYADIMNICTICKAPTQYGDLSDVSVERDSSEEEDWQSPQPGFHNRKQKHSSMNVISDYRRSEDTELGLLLGDETQNVNISRSSSELSFGYQEDLDNDDNAGKTPLETRPPFRDVEAQHIYEPASTQVFHESDSETEDETSQANFIL